MPSHPPKIFKCNVMCILKCFVNCRQFYYSCLLSVIEVNLAICISCMTLITPMKHHKEDVVCKYFLCGGCKKFGAEPPPKLSWVVSSVFGTALSTAPVIMSC